MGQVIHLNSLSLALPAAAVSALDKAETVLLRALRTWVAAYRTDEDPLLHLCETMDGAGVHDAAFSVEQLMAVVARSARRSIAIHCPRCPHLSDDERRLLGAAALVQAGDISLVERALRAAFLSAAGAEFIIGPLEGLAELFREAGLLFFRRWTTANHLPPKDHASSSPDPAWVLPN